MTMIFFFSILSSPVTIMNSYWRTTVKLYSLFWILRENMYNQNSHNSVYYFSSVQFSGWVVSDSLQPHGLQHARPPCPSPTPRVYSNPCPLSWWCHPTFSSPVVPFSSRLQSFPPSGSFQMSEFFASGGQRTGVSALASFLPKKSQGWSPSEWTGCIFLPFKRLSRVFSNTTVQVLCI